MNNEMVRPKVSVIVPVYNVEKYVEKCLLSLLHQTLKSIEILVVNDGSTDGSLAVLEALQMRYNDQFLLFSKPNGGLSDARNYGLERASGDFIGFVDSDDFVLPTMYEELHALAEKHNAQMVICNIQKVDEDGMVTHKMPQIPNMPEKIELKNHFSVFSDISYFACNKLFSRELFSNKRFKKGVHFEDIQLIPQLLLQCSTIAQTQVYHYQYLERGDSISKTHTAKGLDILKAVMDVEDAFEKSKYANEINGLKNFQILEGVYTYLAYLAYVKEDALFYEMGRKLDEFLEKRKISVKDILKYTRFHQNYILSLPFKKKMYYLLYFANQKKLIRKLL